MKLRQVFEKVNKIGKPLSSLTKTKREGAQINRIRNKREVTTDTTEIHRHLRNFINCMPKVEPRRSRQITRNIQSSQTES